MLSYDDIKKFYKDAKQYGAKNGLIVLIAFIAGFSFCYFYIYPNRVTEDPIQTENKASAIDSLNQDSSISELNQSDDYLENSICFSDSNLSDKWETRHYSNLDEEGFYCPSPFARFSSPDIWYKSLIPAVFKSVKIKYQLKNKESLSEMVPSFIFSVGDSPRIFRFYVPEINPQLLGFEKIDIKDPESGLKREEPKTLKKGPVQYKAEVDLTIRSMIKEGNKVSYTFNLDYISGVTGDKLVDSFSYDVSLPNPNPGDKDSKIKIGIGTLKNNCIKVISYEICY